MTATKSFAPLYFASFSDLYRQWYRIASHSQDGEDRNAHGDVDKSEGVLEISSRSLLDFRGNQTLLKFVIPHKIIYEQRMSTKKSQKTTVKEKSRNNKR